MYPEKRGSCRATWGIPSNLVVIDNLYVVSVTIRPAKANPPLVIHANAVLALAIPLEFLKSIAARNTKVLERIRRIQDQ